MSRFIIDPTDRVARLKQRLGIRAKRWKLRIKIGGWLTLTPPMLKSLRLGVGDVIEWKLAPQGIEWKRKPDKSRVPLHRIRQPRQLGKYETAVCAWRSSYRRHNSEKGRSSVLPNGTSFPPENHCGSRV